MELADLEFPCWSGCFSRFGERLRHHFRIVSTRGSIKVTSRCGRLKTLRIEQLKDYPDAPKCKKCEAFLEEEVTPNPLTTWPQYRHTDKTKHTGGPNVE